MKLALVLGFVAVLVLVGLVTATPNFSGTQRMYVTSDNSVSYIAAQAIAGSGIRHTFHAPGNELTFSADLNQGQINALQRLGFEVKPVEIYQLVGGKPIKGLLQARGTAGKPVCGDGVCQGNEPKTCPQDCEAPPPVCGDGVCNGDETCSTCEADCGQCSSRACLPNAQREYNTYQVGGGNPSDGAGVKVAVLDTGSTKTHPDIDLKLCKDATGRRIKNNCNDNNGHGTHTSGTVGAYGGDDGQGIFGIAPGVDLWAIKVCGQFCFTDDMARGIEYATDQGANIITMSIGGPKSNTVTNAVNYATTNGVLFIASSGNSGPNPNTIGYPAALPNVVAVAANDAGEVVVSFSSRGIDDGNDNNIVEKEVEVSAGGFIVESTWNDGCFEILSGTSMSTPTVAGFAAKNWQGSASATRNFLVNNAEDLTEGFHAATGYDIAAGYGLTTTIANNDGDIVVTVTTDKATYTQRESASITITGTDKFNGSAVANAFLTIGAHFPDGNWAFATGTTDANGQDFFTLNTAGVATGTTVLVSDVSKIGFTFGGGSTSIEVV